eukprot:1146134-Prymnesium_polylepis.2
MPLSLCRWLSICADGGSSADGCVRLPVAGRVACRQRRRVPPPLGAHRLQVTCSTRRGRVGSPPCEIVRERVVERVVTDNYTCSGKFRSLPSGVHYVWSLEDSVLGLGCVAYGSDHHERRAHYHLASSGSAVAGTQNAESPQAHKRTTRRNWC